MKKTAIPTQKTETAEAAPPAAAANAPGAPPAPAPELTPDRLEELISPLVVLDTRIPADAMKRFRKLQAEHEFRRPIADERIATAWIGKKLIYGGEITGHTRGVDGASQFHPVTVHWQAPARLAGFNSRGVPRSMRQRTRGES